MSDAHERWCELADAEAIGESLGADDLAFLRAHGDDPAHADELALYAELGELAEPDAVRADDRARAEEVLQRFRATQVRTGRSRVVGVAAIGLAVAATIALVVSLRPRAEPRQDAVIAGAQVSRGGLVLAGSTLATGDAIPGGEWVRATADACVVLEGARACFDDGTELRVVDRAIEVRAGAVRVESGVMTVLGGDAARSLGAGERVAVDAAPVAPIEPVAPERHAAAVAPRVIPPSPEVTTVAPRPESAARRSPSKSASEMLAEARSLANARELSRAVAAYEELRRAHPGSAEAHAASVSTGELQLRRGRAREALRAFDRYLERGGALAEEARWGRVRALDALGRVAPRDRAIEQLLVAHPRTIYADEARAMRDR